MDETVEKQKIKEDPYKYICGYVESLYPKTGGKVFEILSLMPCSLIIPDLPFMGKTVRSNINCLFLAPSGSGKTSLSKLFAEFTYYPLEIESISPARLESEISKVGGNFSLIVGDYARMSRDPILNKVLEGIMGEEKRISRKTMRTDIDEEVNGVSLLCGVATDLYAYILGGMIWRVVPILLGHDAQEHTAIGEHIKDMIGNTEFREDKTKIIREYYLDLASISNGTHKVIKPITGYNIEKKYRDDSFKEWNELTQKILTEVSLNFFREYQEFFRFLCASAFLNIYNRKVENGILYPNEKDFKIALALMRRSIIFKYRLMKSERMAKGIQSAKEFDEILKSSKVDSEYKTILKNLVKFKNGRPQT